MSKDKFKDLFYEKLYDHETEIQQSDWEIISERIRKKRRRKIIPLFYIYGTTGVAVALLIIMFLVKPDNANTHENITSMPTSNIKTSKPEKNTETIIIDNQNAHTAKHTNKPTETAYNQNNEYGEMLKNYETDANINKPVEKIEKINNTNFTVNSHIDIIEELLPQFTIAKTAKISEKQESKPESDEESTQKNNSEEWWNQAETKNTKEKNKWILAVASGNNLGSGSVISDFTDNKQPHIAMQSDYAGLTNIMPIPNAMPESLKTEEATDIKHQYPLNLGIRIKKSIGTRIIMKTGLSYSYFLSEFNNMGRKIQQQIHYVGIPVGVEFLLWNKNSFNIYLSGEFAAEKGISYHYREAAQEISDIKSYKTDDGSVHGLQFSANAGLGISYNFLKNIGIYVEPNAVYYIKDIRQPQSFRTEKPFNFGLNIGLKYDF
ncbi:MAG: hypothetical protein LBP63_06725 [Prevotellaceae bacterium]|jgi:hypothetical protein|nr:hypothetical protein [Prevotellaceae bacterium]